ncbi:WD40 repeat-like protein [Fistulina hepatica ATCC 64428]|uniref:WD40 repeat-like protein n=1 Tax=Fistulina hepatica ATCC 64428 TaxID=1128425 RepID=A0A0D7A5J2_9AGAR|nr:WD40 repeat-like protein [Fistulina hepatica ATCC 64428]
MFVVDVQRDDLETVVASPSCNPRTARLANGHNLKTRRFFHGNGSFHNRQLETVNCIAINATGTLLAAGGDNGIRVWDLASNLELPCPRLSESARSKGLSVPKVPSNTDLCVITTTLQWKNTHTVLSGSSTGHISCWTLGQSTFVQLWRCQVWPSATEDASISQILVHAHHLGRIAVISKEKRIAVIEENTTNEGHEFSPFVTWAGKLHGPVHGLKFDGNGILVASRLNLSLSIHGFKDAAHQDAPGQSSTKTYAFTIGSSCATLSSQGKLYMTTGIPSGLVVFTLHADGLHQKIISVCSTQGGAGPRSLAFMDDGNIVLYSSGERNVHMINRETGEILQVLKHGRNLSVGALTATPIGGDRDTIVTASKG